MIRVARVRKGSIAADLEIQVGSSLLSLNGEKLRDALDLQYLEATGIVELEVELPGGRHVTYEIEKDDAESLGLVPEADLIRRCTNACSFCFVKGNPKTEKLRAGLYIKDDDYRLSFMYGHYVTLTNLREEDWARIEEQRLSPLYVSVHATDPEARAKMLVNPRSRAINEQLDRLEEAGVAFHAQAVLCPGVNDGAVLERTIQDLYERGDSVLSLSVVPVGLTRFNENSGVRSMNREECERTLRQTEPIRQRALEERGYAWCYASDEMFLLAGRDVPGREYFDDDELVANGVGAISSLREAVRADLPGLPSFAGRTILLITGTAMGPTLAKLGRELQTACAAEIRTVSVPNSMYGPQVTSAGLVPGADYLNALRGNQPHDMAILPQSAVNEQGLFLDDVSLNDVRAAVPMSDIRTSDHVTDVLLRWN
jgi:putative radical SAM enzyme (TIGR03279 family)